MTNQRIFLDLQKIGNEPRPFDAEVRRLAAAEHRKLSEQALTFLKMGYEPGELIVVERRHSLTPGPDDVGVYPRSIADEPRPSSSSG